MRILALVLLASPVFSQSATATGVGGGGWLHAGAFHPSDDTVVVLGADVSGVLRTDDFGRSWRAWNEGLANPHEANERYVDDLLGVRLDGVDWFFAATYGGIHRRRADGLDEWERMTPLPELSFKGTTDFEAKPIPFCCLDDDGKGRLLVAGAGRSRWLSASYETDYYPGVAALDPAWTAGQTTQWTVWRYDTQSRRPAWEPFPGSQGLGAARDISVVKLDGKLLVAVATLNGVYLWRGAGWIDVGEELHDDLGLSAWSVHLTRRGSLFVGTAREGGPGSSGVYRIADVRDELWGILPNFPPRAPAVTVQLKPLVWEWVGDTTLMPPVGTKTLEELGQNAQQPYLTVVDGVGNAPDRLYLGVRSAFTPRNAGVYVGDLDQDEPGDACTWRHAVYGDFLGAGEFAQYYLDGAGVQKNLDSGWLDYFGSEVLWHPTASTTERLVFQLNGRLHTVDLARDYARQRYTESSTVGSETYWASTGYNELSVRGLAFYPDGRLVQSSADVGSFVSETDELARFRRLAVTYTSATSSTTDLAWNPATSFSEIRPAWGSPAEDSLFLNSGDIVQRQSPCKLFRVDPDGDWHNVTSSFDADPDVGGLKLEFLQLGDFAFVSDDEVWVIYTEFDRSLRTSPTGAKRIGAGVLRGEHSAGSWDWSLVNAGLGVTDATIPETRNTQGQAILYNPPSGRVFLAARNVKYNELSPAASINGGVFAADPTAGSITWERIVDPDTTNYRDFYSIAQYEGSTGTFGATIYAGGRGRSTGHGTVLRWANPGADYTAWSPIANDTTTPFDFAVPFSRDAQWSPAPWDATTANRKLTDVRALAVHPGNKDVIVAGLYSPNLNEQVGLWRWHANQNPPWTHLSPDEAFEGIGVSILAFSPTVTNRLVLGTNGQELHYKTVGTQVAIGM